MGAKITVLYNKFGGLCHYCGKKTFRKQGGSLMATKDHVVPKSLGGANCLTNYVLACSTCNNDRGTTLFYCDCSFCTTLIARALDNPEFLLVAFNGIVRHSKPIIFKHGDGRWVVRIGHGRKHFNTWAQALAYSQEI